MAHYVQEARGCYRSSNQRRFVLSLQHEGVHWGTPSRESVEILRHYMRSVRASVICDTIGTQLSTVLEGPFR